MWEERNILNSLLWEAAVDDMGIYPKSVHRNGVDTPRTEWQEGWNAAVIKITDKYAKFTAWANKLTDEQRTQIVDLLDSDIQPVWLHYDDNVRLRITCGDTFAYACADAEDFELSDLPEIYRLWNKHGYDGLVAWIARKRQAEPVKEIRYHPGYLAARADLQ